MQNSGLKIPTSHAFIFKTKILSTRNLFFCKFATVCQNCVANLHCLWKNCHFLAHLYFLTKRLWVLIDWLIKDWFVTCGLLLLRTSMMGVSHFDINVQKSYLHQQAYGILSETIFDNFCPISVPAVVVVVLLIATIDKTNKVHLILQCKYYVRL